MENLIMSSTESRIQSLEDGLSHVANGSSVPSSSSSSLMHRKIEFHSARKHFTGFGNSNGDFRIETLNSDSASRKRLLGLNPLQSCKRVDGLDSPENGLDPELSYGITFRRIGAGLENLGNTCFLNSVLQCLTYTEPLAAYLQSGKHQNSSRFKEGWHDSLYTIAEVLQYKCEPLVVSSLLEDRITKWHLRKLGLVSPVIPWLAMTPTRFIVIFLLAMTWL